MSIVCNQDSCGEQCSLVLIPMSLSQPSGAGGEGHQLPRRTTTSHIHTDSTNTLHIFLPLILALHSSSLSRISLLFYLRDSRGPWSPDGPACPSPPAPEGWDRRLTPLAQLGDHTPPRAYSYVLALGTCPSPPAPEGWDKDIKERTTLTNIMISSTQHHNACHQ